MSYESTWTVWPEEKMEEAIQKVHHEYIWKVEFVSPQRPFVEEGAEPTFRTAYHSMKQAEAAGLGIA